MTTGSNADGIDCEIEKQWTVLRAAWVGLRSCAKLNKYEWRHSGM